MTGPLPLTLGHFHPLLAHVHVLRALHLAGNLVSGIAVCHPYPSEGESQKRDLLLVTVSRREDMISRSSASDSLLSTLSYFVQTFGLADVDEVEDVPRIGTNGAGDFLHVCSSRV